MDAVPAGSFLAVSHPSADVATVQTGQAVANINQRLATPATMRTRTEINLFFDGLQLAGPPGVVQLHRWYPGRRGPGPSGDIAGFCGVARKTHSQASR